MANQIIIDIGAAANDGTGDPLRTAFNYVNDNFSNVWNTGLPSSNVLFSGNRILTSNTNGNLILAPNGIGKVVANVDIRPNANNTLSLGSSDLRWNSAYTQNLNVYGTATLANVGIAGGTITIPVANLHIGGGSNGYVLQTDGTGNLTWTAQTGGGGNGVPGGANTQIQFNDSGVFGGAAGFTFNKTSNSLSIAGNISTSSNVIASGYVSATGNVRGGNINTAGIVSAGGSVVGASITLTSTGTAVNASGGNILTNKVTGTQFAFLNGAYTATLTGGGATSNYTLNLPANAGTDGQVLKSDGTGNLVWGAGSNTFTAITMSSTPSGPSNQINYGMGNLVAWLDGQWTIGEYDSSTDTYGATGIRISPGIEGSAEVILPSNDTANVTPLQVNNYAGNVQIETGNGSTNRYWTFDGNSAITLPPGGYVQTANSYPTLLAYGSGGHGGPELDWANTDNLSNLNSANVLRHTMYLNGEEGLYIGFNENGVANVASPSWLFTPDGNLTLPGNTFAVNYANGTQVNISGGSANTGNVTFNNTAVQGVAGLQLSASPTDTGNLKYLQVRGGDTDSHIHFDTGDNDIYDQYFGDDNQFVRLDAGLYANVTIGTQNPGESYRWTFDNVGDTTVPGDIKSITTGFAFTSAITGITAGATVIVDLANNSIFGGPEEGQVTISGVVGTTEANATWYYQAVEANQIQLFYSPNATNPVDGTGWAAYESGGLAVAAGYNDLSVTGGNVSIRSNPIGINQTANTWTFGADGTTTFPANIIAQTTNANLEVQTASGGSIGFDRSFGGAYMQTSDPINFGTSNWSVETYVYLQDTDQNILAGTATTPGLNIYFFGTTFVVQSDDGVTNTWNSVVPTLDTWHHIAVGYNGEGINAWLDGVQLTGGQQTTTAIGGDYGNNVLYVGSMPWDSVAGSAMSITNMRIVVGGTLYDPNNSTITVPQPKLTIVEGTQLLLLANTGPTAYDDASGNYGITTNRTTWSAVTPTVTVGTNNWQFDNLGNLYLPNNGVIATSGNDIVITNSSLLNGDITIQANNSVTVSGGDSDVPNTYGGWVYVTGGNGGPDSGVGVGGGGSVEVTGGLGANAISDAAGEGGEVRITGGAGGTANAANSINAGSGGPVYIFGGQAGDVDGANGLAVNGPAVEIHGGLGSFNNTTMIGRPGDVLTQGGGNGWIGASGNVYSKTSPDGYGFYTWGYINNGRTLYPIQNVPRGDTTGGTIGGYALVGGAGDQEFIISTPNGSADINDSQRIVINPGKGADDTFGEGGDIYLWAGRGGTGGGSGGDIKVRGGQGMGSGGAGGYIRMEAGDGDNAGGGAPGYIEITGGQGGTGQNGGYVRITSGQGDVSGGDANIRGGYGASGSGGTVNIIGGQSGVGLANYGNVNINSGANTWTFDNTGVLTVPGEGIIRSIGDTVTLQSYDLPNATAYGMYVGTTGGLYFQQGSNPTWLSISPFDSNTQILGGSGTGGGAGKNITITAGAADQTDYYTTPGGNLNLQGGLGAGNDGGGGGPGGSVNITSGFSNDPAGRYGNVTINTGISTTWSFDYTGNVTTPGSIVTGNGSGGNISGANVISANTISASGNITATGNISVGNILAQNIRTIEGTVHVGQGAGLTNQGTYAIAMGRFAGGQDQGAAGLAIGQLAGQTSQGQQAIALGLYAGANTQSGNAVAIGTYAGQVNQGLDAIAIGRLAGNTSQGNNSIILNATGAVLDQSTANTFTVAPIRNDVANISQVMFYNTTSKEVTYGNTISVAGNITGANLIATANVLGSGYARFTGTFDESQASTAGLYLGYAGGTPRMMFGTGNTSQTFEIDNDGGNLRFYQPGSTKATLTPAGDFSVAGNVTGNTAGYAIGYRDIPQVSFTGNATIATTDAGKHYYSTQSTSYTLTIANNASQGFQVGAAISIVNQGTGNITIAQGSGVTLYIAGNATSGNRTISTFGMATLMKVATNTWFINGTGVS